MSKTVEEIAKATGFSGTTVRLIVNGQADKYRISARTRQIVEDFVAVHGYAPSPGPRAPRAARSECIGLIAPRLDDPFVARLMEALQSCCDERQALLLAAASYEDPERENRAIVGMLEREICGLAILPCQPSSMPLLRSNKTSASIVLLDRDFPSWPFPAVVSDHFQGGLDLGRRLLEISAGFCFFLCGAAEAPESRARTEGFFAACKEMGLDTSLQRVWCDAGYGAKAGAHLMGMLIDDLREAPPAIICSSTQVLEGALRQLKAQMGEVSPSLAIGTFDDSPILDLLPNRIVSFRQDEVLMARHLITRLLAPRDLVHPAPPRERIPYQILCRNL